MNTKLTEQIEEIALLVVMLGGDEQETLLVVDLVAALKEEAAKDPAHARLVEACAHILSEKEAGDVSKLVEELNAFVSAAQSYLQDPDAAIFSNEKESSPWGDDLSPQADDELIVEFIEKHTSLLEDYEAALLEAVGTDGTINPDSLTTMEELQAYLKGYLHNIKGDAGSVGLIGVQNATHYVEDALLERSPEQLIEQLLSYKEWLLSVLSAYSNGQAPACLSDGFLNNFRASLDLGASESASVGEVADSEHEASAAPVEKEFVAETYQISGDGEILVEFLTEAEDHLSSIENLLLDKEEYDKDDLGAIFRAVHSIKGGSSYFNLKEVTTTSHTTENLMDEARNDKLVFNNALKSIVLKYIDVQRKLLEAAREAVEGNGELLTSEDVADFAKSIDDYMLSVEMIKELNLGSALDLVGDVSPTVESASPEKVEIAAPAVEAPVVEAAVEKVAEVKTEQKETAPVKKEATPEKKTEKVKVKNFIKIDTERLDHLIEYIGEMVISSSMLIKNCHDYLGENESVIANCGQLERISREIQEIGMSMRLVPVKGLFQKMSRVVWDTTKKLSKDIKFEMEGEDTELDRSVIDKLADPLMHMVRNAVDHGIEMPEERVAAGKSSKGTVKLAAYHSGGSIYIEIKDDGKGLDREKLIAHAIKKGILTEDQKLSDEEAFMLIFAAGFSTATVVTDVSGRGVGMDVVRRNIESMRGRVSIKSEIGKGSTFTIELPLTLAIMEGIETTIGDENFIIPTLSILEFLRPTEDMVMNTLDKGETLKFREQFLPIFRISELYNVQPRFKKITDCIAVIVENNGKLVAFIVDSVLGKLSAVIKNLGSVYKDVKGVSGCAIMPNGSIGLILDVATLVELAQSVDRTAVTHSLPSRDTLEKALTSERPIH